MKNILIALFLLLGISVNAQPSKYQFSDDFETNSNGWTESVSKKSKAVIQNGELKIENKSSKSFASSYCFVGLKVRESFTMSCKARIKKIDDKSSFGMLIDYKDEGNFIAFVITEGNALLIKYVNGQHTDGIYDKIKLKSKKDAEVNLSIESAYEVVKFYVNGVKALEVPNLVISSNGVGFYVKGEQSVSFDNLNITQ